MATPRRAGSAPRGGNLFGELGTTYDLENSIVANGIAGAGPNCTVPDTSSSFVSSGYNIDSLDECGFHAAGDQPKTGTHLLPLVDNGGQTDTEALAADSPAIDAGSPDCPGADVDQRGVARPQPSGGRCDIGAFELVSTELCGDCLDNDRNGLTDLEDPACCRPAESLTLRASRLAPIHGGAKLKMGGALAPLTLQSGGATEDLFVQLRVEDQPDFLWRGSRRPTWRAAAPGGRSRIGSTRWRPRTASMPSRSSNGRRSLCSRWAARTGRPATRGRDIAGDGGAPRPGLFAVGRPLRHRGGIVEEESEGHDQVSVGESRRAAPPRGWGDCRCRRN